MSTDERGASSRSDSADTGRPNVVVRAWNWTRRHRALASAVAVVAAFVTLTQVPDAIEEIADRVHEWRNPFDDDYEKLARLDLGVTPDFLTEWLGEARRSVDLCREIPCPPEAESAGLTMKMYESERVSVRAIFVESSLEWYAVTLMSDDLEPQMTWLDYNLGKLGRVTYVEALEVPDVDVEPTDLDMFLGPQSSAYVEIVAAGAPGNYEGLILGFAPTGWSGEASFDREAADAVTQLNDAPFEGSVAEPFRAASRPNTYGRFIDDGGIVSRLARDAEFDQVLLYQFTTP